MANQLSDHFDTIFNEHLCAFRKQHGCQTFLIKLLEVWKKSLDDRQYAAAILMDLSKAFDCLPHDILLGKLEAYGVKETGQKISIPTPEKQNLKENKKNLSAQ